MFYMCSLFYLYMGVFYACFISFMFLFSSPSSRRVSRTLASCTGSLGGSRGRTWVLNVLFLCGYS